MKARWNKKSKLDRVRHGYRTCLAYVRVKKYLGWFYVYCDNTNLHGFRYISMGGSSIIESVLWFVVCISSIVFCVILMLRLWANYSNNPIVTTIYTSNPIWNVPFPAVTICNNNKVYRPHADLIAKDFASYLMQPCSALLLRCAWLGKIHDCGKIFKTVKSNEGFCCSFNSHYDLNVGHLSNDTYYNFTDFNVSSEDPPGVRKILNVPGSGRDVGLAVALNIEPDKYKATSRPYVGATVMIHDPIDFPDIGAHVASVQPGHVLAISVAGTSIKGMESLRSIPLEKRSCYFDNEVPGEVRYSYQSCISQCISRNIYRLCGCLPFYYPEEREGIKKCYLPDINCLLHVRNFAKTRTCKRCLPQCSDMMYNIDPENMKMEDVGFYSDLTYGFDINNVSFVYVFFGDVSYVEYRKENVISWDSLLASFGGIFGLCLGGSVMSVIELAYLVARQLYRRQPRKGQEQSRTKLPPASEVFLSIPAKEKVQLQKPRDRERSDDKRVLVTWYEPALHHRKTARLDDMNYVKHVKF
ncbi:PREDICTED: pickpocket protein 28-like [Wasmannia auropunctata]|uniref:pickpocket protein 28-like n=1 Tax=Wasmannia auropunctata TaxID=64793 RepID=UPI0005ED7434|nr:PREDICTED: pickpocket protein 28-like [Wasmannia auropunctata]